MSLFVLNVLYFVIMVDDIDDLLDECEMKFCDSVGKVL